MKLKKLEFICRFAEAVHHALAVLITRRIFFRLVCEVHYTTPAGLQESFRKFFKFQVLKPLDVKTKFYNAETDEVYLEAQVNQFLIRSNNVQAMDFYFIFLDPKYYGRSNLLREC